MSVRLFVCPSVRWSVHPFDSLSVRSLVGLLVRDDNIDDYKDDIRINIKNDISDNEDNDGARDRGSSGNRLQFHPWSRKILTPLSLSLSLSLCPYIRPSLSAHISVRVSLADT